MSKEAATDDQNARPALNSNAPAVPENLAAPANTAFLSPPNAQPTTKVPRQLTAHQMSSFSNTTNKHTFDGGFHDESALKHGESHQIAPPELGSQQILNQNPSTATLDRAQMRETQTKEEVDDPMQFIDIDGDGSGDLRVPIRTIALLSMIKERVAIYTLTAFYYEKRSFYIVIPTILITAASGVLAFLTTSQMMDAETKMVLSQVVGFLATVATILSSFNQVVKWDAKAEIFKSAAQQYDLLLKRVELKQFNLRPLVLTNGELDAARIQNRSLEIQWQSMIVDEILDVQKRLQFLPPYQEVAKWRAQGLITGVSSGETPFPKHLRAYQDDLKRIGVEQAEDLACLQQEDFDGIPGFPQFLIRKILREAKEPGRNMNSSNQHQGSSESNTKGGDKKEWGSKIKTGTKSSQVVPLK